MSEEATKTRKAKPESHLVIGLWKNGDFVPGARQPEPGINDLHKMVAWAKKEYAELPGGYEFIRKVKGMLTLAKQEVLNSTWA